MPRILITGANGQLGRRLIATLPPDVGIAGLVRSARARRILERHVGDRPGLEITLGDPSDPSTLATLAAHCEAVVHLIGTIRETRDNRYADSHERPARALMEAARHSGIRHIVYVSILGADMSSECRCLRARAAVEEALLRAPTPATIIRVPMVLGEGDRASRALVRRSAARHVFLYRASSLEQPIYAGDVIAAITNALQFASPVDRVFELAGPESLSRRTLVTRAAATLQRLPVIHSLPLALGLAIAGVLEKLSPRPPITRDMLRVLDHDDAIDPRPAAATLGVSLTPLDVMLDRCVARGFPQAETR